MANKINYINVAQIEHVETNSGLGLVALHVLDNECNPHIITLSASLLKEAHYQANSNFEAAYLEELKYNGR